jgi:hypothetical protein
MGCLQTPVFGGSIPAVALIHTGADLFRRRILSWDPKRHSVSRLVPQLVDQELEVFAPQSRCA